MLRDACGNEATVRTQCCEWQGRIKIRRNVPGSRRVTWSSCHKNHQYCRMYWRPLEDNQHRFQAFEVHHFKTFAERYSGKAVGFVERGQFGFFTTISPHSQVSRQNQHGVASILSMLTWFSTCELPYLPPRWKYCSNRDEEQLAQKILDSLTENDLQPGF